MMDINNCVIVIHVNCRCGEPLFLLDAIPHDNDIFDEFYKEPKWERLVRSPCGKHLKVNGLTILSCKCGNEISVIKTIIDIKNTELVH